MYTSNGEIGMTKGERTITRLFGASLEFLSACVFVKRCKREIDADWLEFLSCPYIN